MLTFKYLILSALHFLLTILLIALLDLGLVLLLDYVLPNWIRSFEQVGIFGKFVMLFVCGGSVLAFIFSLSEIIAKWVSEHVYDRLPVNKFTIISSSLMAILNGICLTYLIWMLPTNYTIWAVAQLATINLFAIGLCSIFRPVSLTMIGRGIERHQR